MGEDAAYKRKTIYSSSLEQYFLSSEEEDRVKLSKLKLIISKLPLQENTCKVKNDQPERSSRIGFGELPAQVFRKAVRKGFEFNIMVVGESGLGKSTLINSMFLTNVYSADNAIETTNKLEVHRINLEENGVKLALTVVDSPGFGDAINNANCWKPITEYIEKQFDDHLQEETKVVRENIPDSRIHACLYFLSPTGHGMKSLDISCMQRISKIVNIVPIIAKADTLTQAETNKFKIKVRLFLLYMQDTGKITYLRN